MSQGSILYWLVTISFGALLLTGCSQRVKHTYDWNSGEGYRWARLAPGTVSETGFRKLPPSETNLRFSNIVTEKDISENRHYLNGSGVALGDVDGDGWTDLYLARLDGSNKLFRNEGGFRFTDITDSAGVGHGEYYSTGVVFADVEGDRDLDLLVTSMSRDNVLYINDGKGRFARSPASGLGESRGSLSMALADIEGDGDLDLYIANNKQKSVLDLFNIRDLSWEKTVREPYDPDADRTYSFIPPFDEHYEIIYKEGQVPERREIGRKDELYLNNGDGTFTKVTDPAERFVDAEGNPRNFERDWGLAARFHDLNGDGFPDLYVCNDYWTRDRIWINRGDGTFREIDPLAIRNLSFSSMSVDFSDVNRDGHWDLFATEMLSPEHSRRLRQFIPDDPHPNTSGDYGNRPQYNRNSFYLNRGDNTFAEISYFSNLEASEWTWASRFLDVDLDGYEDLLVTTGYTYDVQDLDAQDEWRDELLRNTRQGGDIHLYPPLELTNKSFRNNGDLTFTEVSRDWGFRDEDVSHGLATADFDHDGDLDLAVNRLNREALLYENLTSEPRIAVRLIGNTPNTQAVGAQIELHGGPVYQSDEITSGGEYLSGSDPLVVFAADPDNSNHRISVTWPDGRQSSIDSVRANRIYEIEEPQEAVQTTVKTNAPSGINTDFRDVSGRIEHRHHEAPYDDFRVQPLLPNKLSQQGPGVAWFDYDSDGNDDLFVATGRGGRLGLFRNSGDGSFGRRSSGRLTETAAGDQTAILGLKGSDGPTLFVGTANYEPGDIRAPSAEVYTMENSGGKPESIPGVYSTTGPLAAADYDGDGDLDLFVGGRFVPAHYPSDASSRLFFNENGTFVLDEANSAKLKDLGMATSALFTDYDLDGDPDLLISREWDSIKLYRNQNGNFTDVSEATGLSGHSGWWSGIATGDFNNDGRPDIVAANRGLNSPYQLDSGKPLKMYYQDFNRDGRVDIIEAYYENGMDAYVPRRQKKQFESASLDFLVSGFNNRRFANASLNEILGNDPERNVASKEINTLSHTLFINEGDRFSANPLPDEAQFTAAFYAGVADYDNDGNEDLFLSQNFFDVRPNTPRLDAGRGLWLKGDGDGGFRPVPGQQSGIKAYGDQRGAALGDFNNDGKVDLAVAQNAADTKLYLNQTQKTGISVRLEGSENNKDGIGSAIRLVYEDGTKGARREIQAGSGYWSQNSAVQVLGFSSPPAQIEVTWFDGTVQTVEIQPGKWSYRVSHPADQP